MTGPQIPEGAVKLHAIGEAYADVAQLEEPLSRMFMVGSVMPTVTLPQKPPPARARYLPGVIGTQIAAVAARFSYIGLFNRDDLSRVIVEIYAVSIQNQTAGSLLYQIMRDDQPVQSGATFSAWVPAYSDAASSSFPALGMNRANNNVAAPGVTICDFGMAANSQQTFPFHAVINNGQIAIASGAVNQEVIAQFWFRVYPIIQQQRAG